MEQIPFHKHLDICDRCRTNPFDLCPLGDSLLMAAPTAPVGQPKPCANCGHANPHTSPAGDVADGCNEPGCNCGYYTPAANALPKTGADDPDEAEILEVIDERDAAEEALSQAYFLVIGESPEWSNLFGHAEALEAIDDAQKILRQSLAAAQQEIAESAAPAANALPETDDKISDQRLKELTEAFDDIGTEDLMLDTCANTDGFEIADALRQLAAAQQEIAELKVEVERQCTINDETLAKRDKDAFDGGFEAGKDWANAELAALRQSYAELLEGKK